MNRIRRTRKPTFLLLFVFIAIATVGLLKTLRPNNTNNPETAETYTYKEVYVPVTAFTDPRSDISSAELDTVELINIKDLTPDKKLLSVDGAYYLDDFEHGAKIIEKTSDKKPDTTLPTKETTLSFAQTGVTALTRAMTTKLNQVGDGAYFAENIADFLKTKDLTHLSNEVSFADDCPGGTGTTTLCADWRALDTITAVGADIIELTGNHNNDYGAENNLKTIEKYEELGLKTFGGGKDEETAKVPLKISEKGTNITLIGVNNSTSTKENGQGAMGDHPGANIYDEDTVKTQISEAKASGNFVIVDVQYFECYCYPEEGEEMPECDAPISGQTAFFRHLIDLGADMVIGTQAHQPQTYELYDGKPIYYGLGNLFFDQIYWPGTTRSLILTHYFMNGKHLQTRLTPTVYDSNFQPTLMDEEAAQVFLTRLLQSQPS